MELEFSFFHPGPFVSDTTYILGQPQFLYPLIAVGLVFGILVFRTYRRQVTASPTIRILCGSLKVLGFSILAFCLLEPLFRAQRPIPGENVFLLLADKSRSLNVHNRGAKLTRGDVLRENLRSDQTWQVRLAQDFDVRKYLVGTKLQTVENFEGLEFDDTESRLKTGLVTASQRLKNRNVAGVLFFTDGNSTDNRLEVFRTDQLPPVYPVVQGDGEPITDLEVGNVSVSQTNFEASPIRISATINSRHAESPKVVAELLNQDGLVVQEQVIDVEGSKEVEFKIKPDEPGIRFFTVAVSYANDLERMASGQPSIEGTLANNSRGLVVDRGGSPYRVLYVSGRPNWEFKFLNRAIAGDREVDLVGLIRIAKKKPKFDFRRKGDTTRSDFFKGFEEGDEDTEQYFEPVLIRLGTSDENELRQGFPKTAADLFRYDAIICDDVEAKYFTSEQMVLVQRFVNERGGGFLMLGGQESFSEGNYSRTPVADLLPVYVNKKIARLTDAAAGPSIEDSLPEVYRYRLSRTGRLEPWVRLKSTEEAEANRLAIMPNFASLNKVDGIKPGADELAFVGNPAGETHAALVVQNYGKGRSGALMVGDLWRWGMAREAGAENDLESAWRQTIRWLVADVPRQVEVNVQRPSEILSDFEIVTHVRDEEYLPLDNAELEVSVVDPDGKSFQIDAQPSSSESGAYIAQFPSLVEGNYVVTVLAKSQDGTVIQSRQAGWVYSPVREELQRLEANTDWLKSLAQSTGGEVIEQRRLDEFVRDLPNRKLPVTETKIFPLWHHLAFFWVAIACLVGEWGIRRMNGLP
ncbi:hypothetical protein OAF71_00800 [bacterium]|nr:hypothetical protein [bacterium]